MLTTGQDTEGREEKKVILRFLFYCLFSFVRPFVRSSVRPSELEAHKNEHTFLLCVAGLAILFFFLFFARLRFQLFSVCIRNSVWMRRCCFYIRSFGQMPMHSLDSLTNLLHIHGPIPIECIKLHSFAIRACARACSAVDQSRASLLLL